jgi:hypothetical protein
MISPRKQPRWARIALAGVATATMGLLAVPGPVAAAYPPQPPSRSIALQALATVCENEAPYIQYEVSTNGFDPSEVAGLTATLTVFDSSGTIVEGPLSGQPLVGRILYPGAAVDSSGIGSDWPGWVQEDGLWVPDSTDAHLRSGLRVKVAVNPETTAAVQYPPESQECMSPPGVSPPVQRQAAASAGSLPQTGGTDPTRIMWIALGALAAGALITAASYRRRGAATSER